MKREFNRYAVAKSTDIDNALSDSEKLLLSALLSKIERYRKNAGKIPLECVVVESDWPEYERTWDMIEQRVARENIQAFLFDHFKGNSDVYYGLPYFYIVGRKVVCSDAHSVNRLISYSGYDYAIIARDDEVENELDLKRYNSSTVFYQPCVRIEPEEVIQYKDNYAELINQKLSSLL